MDKLSITRLNRLPRIRAQVFEELPSTNSYLKELAKGKEKEGLLIIAKSQTGGRGRRGRGFFSPKGSGIYMSLLLEPREDTSIELLTSAMAVAVARAVKKVLGLELEIKWVNDLFYRGKKVAGILTENLFSSSPWPDYVIVGLGLNLYAPQGGFSGDLDQAGYLVEEKSQGLFNRIIEAITEEFWPFYDNLARRDFLEEYRLRSLVLGKELMVLEKEPWLARALYIDDSCSLVVQDEKGKIHSLNSGEVSVRVSTRD